jgi:hypothetical protein
LEPQVCVVAVIVHAMPFFIPTSLPDAIALPPPRCHLTAAPAPPAAIPSNQSQTLEEKKVRS